MPHVPGHVETEGERRRRVRESLGLSPELPSAQAPPLGQPAGPLRVPGAVRPEVAAFEEEQRQVLERQRGFAETSPDVVGQHVLDPLGRFQRTGAGAILQAAARTPGVGRIPGLSEFQENVAAQREAGAGRLESLRLAREQAEQQTEQFPSTAIPLSRIPLPFRREVPDIPIGVLGGADILADPTLVVPGIGVTGALVKRGVAASGKEIVRDLTRQAARRARIAAAPQFPRGPLTAPAREAVREAPEAAAEVAFTRLESAAGRKVALGLNPQEAESLEQAIRGRTSQRFLNEVVLNPTTGEEEVVIGTIVRRWFGNEPSERLILWNPNRNRFGTRASRGVQPSESGAFVEPAGTPIRALPASEEAPEAAARAAPAVPTGEPAARPFDIVEGFAREEARQQVGAQGRSEILDNLTRAMITTEGDAPSSITWVRRLTERGLKTSPDQRRGEEWLIQVSTAGWPPGRLAKFSLELAEDVPESFGKLYRLKGISPEAPRALPEGAAPAAARAVPEQQALQPPAQPPTPPRGPDVPVGEVVPQPAAENILGLRPITPGLSRTARIANIARRTIGRPFRAVEDNPVAQAALGERSRVAPIIESQSNILGTVSEQRVTQAFVRDERGRIQSLAGVIPEVGAPTIQDVAARLPIYARALTPEQRAVMAGLRDDVAPFRALLSEVGADVNLGFRTDIIDGGFYLPRGRALEEGADAPLKIRAGGRVAGGGRRGFERTAVFDSQAQGLEVGFEYPSLGDALQSYARDAGQRSTDTHVANFLRSATDEAGVPLGRVTTDVRDRGIIALPDIQNLSFPDEIANAANKILRAEGPPTGAGRFLPATIQAFNNLYRGLRATADNSAVGIQGLLGLASDPRAYKDALKVNLRAWGVGGDRALGKFVLQFNDTASQSGRLTAQQWGTQGLRVGGAQTEFALGRGLPGRIGQLPVIRQANRAFGFFGDTLRLGWADDMLKGELRRGRTLDDLAASGDLERIASSANHMTGWAPGRAGGDIGDLLLFAPRFLQSRLATVANGARALGPGANLEQRQARNSLLKLVGYGTVLTFAVNEMLGNETDVRPIVNGRKNPNFMRIRVAGRDWSVFGTWDSLAGAIISVGQGKPQDILRTMGSGIVSVAWDLISQEDFQGRDVPNTGGEIAEDPGRFAQWILQSVTPFAAEEIPSAVGQVAGGIREGDVGQIGAGVATIGGEVVGAKSTPLSFTDTANNVAQRIGLPTDFETADPFVKDVIEAFPSVVQVASKRPSSLYWRQRNEIDATRLVDLQALLKNKGKVIAGQKIDDRFIANQYFQIVAEASNLKKGQNLGADKEFADPTLESLTPNERALAMWHALTEQEAMEEIFVAKRLQQRRDKFQRELLAQPRGRELWDYVLRNTNRYPIPVGIMNILRVQARSTWDRINASNQARATWLGQNLPGLQLPEGAVPQGGAVAPSAPASLEQSEAVRERLQEIRSR